MNYLADYLKSDKSVSVREASAMVIGMCIKVSFFFFVTRESFFYDWNNVCRRLGARESVGFFFVT